MVIIPFERKRFYGLLDKTYRSQADHGINHDIITFYPWFLSKFPFMSLKLRLLSDKSVALRVALQSIPCHFSDVSEAGREHGNIKLGEKTFHDVSDTFLTHDTVQLTLAPANGPNKSAPGGKTHLRP